MIVTDWSKYPNFSKAELACKFTGRCNMDVEFMDRLQAVRVAYGRSMQVSSGYRDPSHPNERCKAVPGEHTMGRAVDIAIRGTDAVELLKIALDHGFTRIGVAQKGTARFLHLGLGGPGLLPFAIWSY